VKPLLTSTSCCSKLLHKLNNGYHHHMMGETIRDVIKNWKKSTYWLMQKTAINGHKFKVKVCFKPVIEPLQTM
jgi:hypothetical protein